MTVINIKSSNKHLLKTVKGLLDKAGKASTKEEAVKLHREANIIVKQIVIGEIIDVRV